MSAPKKKPKLLDCDLPLEVAFSQRQGPKCNRYHITPLTFRDFIQGLSEANEEDKHGKHGHFYSRGVPIPEGDEYCRNDKSLESANLLILDLDVCTSTPEEVHKIVTKAGYTHGIHTTHSHQFEGKGNRMRVIVPCRISCKEYCAATTRAFFDELVEGGLEAEYASESKNWSQAWYLPVANTESPEDYYWASFMEGKPFVEVEELPVAESVHESVAGSDQQTLDEMYEIIRTGGKPLHNTINKVITGHVKDGKLSRAESFAFIRALGHDVLPTLTKDRQDYFSDYELKRSWEGVPEENTNPYSVHIDAFTMGNKYTNVDWPPGFLGLMAREIHEWMPYPNKQIAIASAHILIAIFCGRKHSFNRLDISRTYVMYGNPSIGKDTALKVAKIILDELMHTFNTGNLAGVTPLEKGIPWSSFHPFGRPHGLRSVLTASTRQLSIVIIQSEGGVASKSTAGDQSSVKAFLMQNQVNAAYHLSDVPPYSVDIPRTYGVPQTVLYESTKQESVFDTGSFGSGEHGRKCIFHLSHKCETDIEGRTEFSNEFLTGVYNMCESAVESEDMFHKMTVEKAEYVGPSTLPVRGRIEHGTTPEVQGRFEAMRAAEKAYRNNRSDDTPVDRDWIEKTRYEMQIRKECLAISIADSVANKTEPVITEEILNYAEHFQQELNRADAANSGDYSDNDDRLIDEIFRFCELKLDPRNEKNATYFTKYHTKKDQKARRIAVPFLCNATGKHKAMASEMAKTDKHKFHSGTAILKTAIRDGESKGYWQIIPANKNRTSFRQEHLIVSVRE